MGAIPAGLFNLTSLSLGKNPLGGVGLKLLLEALGDLKVTSLNICRTVSAKRGGGTGLGSVLRDLGSVLRDKGTVDFFSKVRCSLFSVASSEDPSIMNSEVSSLQKHMKA